MGNESNSVLGGYEGRILLGLSFTWMVMQFIRFFLPPIIPELTADFGITLTAAGLALTVLQASFALVQFFSGRLSDIWERSVLINAGFVLFGLGTLIIGLSTSFLSLLLGTSLVGVGRGAFTIPARALISDFFTEQRGKALGLFTAGTDVGGLVASGLAIFVFTVTVWSVPFVLAAGIIFALLLIYLSLNRESYALDVAAITTGLHQLQIKETGRRILLTDRQRKAIIAYSLFFFMINGVVTFLPSFLQAKGFSSTVANLQFGFLFAMGIVVKPGAGFLSDRFQRHLVSTGGFILSAVALLLLVFTESLIPVTLAVILFAAGYKGQFPVIDAILIDNSPDNNRGGDLGAARSIFFAVGSTGAVYTGYAIETVNYTFAFFTLVTLLFISTIILYRQG